MFKYIYPTFMSIINFLKSALASSLINTVPKMIIYILTKSLILRIVLSMLTGQFILFIVCYILMEKYGYNENKTYKKISILEMSIIIIITVPLISSILSLTIYEFSSYPLLAILRYIAPVIAMIIGYKKGFDKRNKDRLKLINI